MSRIAVIGGAGHVGLPLSIFLANQGHLITIVDKNIDYLKKISLGQMPFLEMDSEPELLRANQSGNLKIAFSPNGVKGHQFIFCVVGTGVDDHGEPKTKEFIEILKSYAGHMDMNSILVLRSTISVGTTRSVFEVLKDLGRGDIKVSYCPERIAEHKAFKELIELPQIISAFDEVTMRRVKQVFSPFTETIEMHPEEAEFAKLICNAWRYSKFAIANEFYLIANSLGLDYEKIRKAAAYNYKRAADLPKAGFAAGPCLPKDTQQLIAASASQELLIKQAHNVNSGLPAEMVRIAQQRFGELWGKKVLVLGFAFKPNSDDSRDSLSRSLAKILADIGARVQIYDPLVLATQISDPTEFDFVQEMDLRDYEIIFHAIPHNHFFPLLSELEEMNNVIRFW